MIIVGQQYGVAFDTKNTDVEWWPTREECESWVNFYLDDARSPDAHLVVRDIGPARNVDGAESPSFAAHADDALGLDS